MKKPWGFITLLIIIAIFTGCASKPETPVTATEPVPEETPVQEAVTTVEEPIKETPPEITINPVTEEEVNNAEAAIKRAEYAGAETYASELYLSAKEDLKKAKTIKESDPEKARALLSSSIENSNNAYKTAIDYQIDKRILKLRNLEKNLIELKTEKFSPEDYSIVKQRADLLEEYYNNGDLENMEKQYNATLRAMQNLYDTIDNNIRWIKILDRDTKAYMKDAENQEVFIWAPEELEKANYMYSEGISQFNNYNLSASEKSFKEAKYWAFHSLKLSRERKRQHETDSLMMETLEALEKASQNRVIDNEGNVIEPQSWTGNDFLDENPAPDATADDFSDNESSLKDFDPDTEIESKDENNAVLPIDGTTSVLGDEQKMTLLKQAIELWKLGVKARTDGKYDIADEYFKQSKAYADAYTANAVANEYIVKRGDTLWAISAREEILDNPFLWTKLWRRNNTLIQNPDLIYPGQKLIVPPK